MRYGGVTEATSPGTAGDKVAVDGPSPCGSAAEFDELHPASAAPMATATNAFDTRASSNTSNVSVTSRPGQSIHHADKPSAHAAIRTHRSSTVSLEPASLMIRIDG